MAGDYWCSTPLVEEPIPKQGQPALWIPKLTELIYQSFILTKKLMALNDTEDSLKVLNDYKLKGSPRHVCICEPFLMSSLVNKSLSQ